MPGGPEVVVILLVALIVLGPDQLPKAMRTFGQAVAEIRKVSSGFQSEMRNVMDTIDSTAKETIGTTPKATSSSSSGAPDRPDGQVEEVKARNERPAPTDVTGSASTPEPPAPSSGPSAADRAAG